MKNAAICQPLGHDERVGKAQAEVCKAGEPDSGVKDFLCGRADSLTGS